MKAEDVTPSAIGRKVKGIENGYEVTGTIVGIIDTEYEFGVKIKLDKPLACWSGDFDINTWIETEYDSTLAKKGFRNNLQLTQFID